MKLTIVYDNKIYQKIPGKPDHGFSCFIETENHNILFDTGSDGTILLENMKLLSINPNTIDIIVISHEHYDHNGGLYRLRQHLVDTRIYRLDPDISKENINEIQVTKPIQITKKILTTGRLHGTPLDEQSLIIETENGLFVITGCSHPGVSQILKAAEKKGKVAGILGGFHGFSEFSILNNLNAIYPCHCTKYKKEIYIRFPKKSYACGVGLTLEL
jgi:7,8-dihydropterin-6-yl-methyl-4-(beta-D-ribofuranosyl)aminobenzene 5'-phosphate synthase